MKVVSVEFPEKACMTSACKIGVLVAVLSAGQDVDVPEGMAYVVVWMLIPSVSPDMC